MNRFARLVGVLERRPPIQLSRSKSQSDLPSTAVKDIFKGVVLPFGHGSGPVPDRIDRTSLRI